MNGGGMNNRPQDMNPGPGDDERFQEKNKYKGRDF